MEKKLGSLVHQLYMRLQTMMAIGKSKHTDKKKGKTQKRIYSFNTFHRYYREGKNFLTYIKLHHPECRRLDECRKYCAEWINYEATRILKNGRTQSAWTISLKICALNKIFQIEPGDPDRITAPKRYRADIIRSRGITQSDMLFFTEDNLSTIHFLQSTGCRREIAEKVRGSDYMTIDDLKAEMEIYDSKAELSPEEEFRYPLIKEALTYFPDCEHFLLHYKDKGGRSRIAPILGPFRDMAVELLKKTPKEEKVLERIPNEAGIHSFRNDYSCSVYRRYARRIKDIPYDRVNKGSEVPYQSDVYILRKDQYGRKLDRTAMAKVSKALGHNRIRVAADNYLYGMEDEDHEDD